MDIKKINSEIQNRVKKIDAMARKLRGGNLPDLEGRIEDLKTAVGDFERRMRMAKAAGKMQWNIPGKEQTETVDIQITPEMIQEETLNG